MITLYYINGANHIYNFAITIPTQTAAPKQAEQTATRKRTQTRHSPSKQRRQGGQAMTRKAPRPAPSRATRGAGRLMTASRMTRGAIGQGGDDILQGKTGREARRGARRETRRRAEWQASRLSEMTGDDGTQQGNADEASKQQTGKRDDGTTNETR